MTAGIERACGACGRSFAPASKTERTCSRCRPRGREHSSPSTQAQDAEYHRNRRIVLKGDPPCALRLLCAGAPATTADHIVAVANGGSNAITNLQPACATCNRSKGASSSSGRRQAEATAKPASRPAPTALRLT